jgi:hypothetical protein
MDCTDFIARFSEYFDGTGPEDFLRDAREHEASCERCGRYRRVVEEGSALLKDLPDVDLEEDFAPRLQHRLYHVDEDLSVGRQGSSGTSAFTALGMAILVTVVAWSPMLKHEPVVELDPIEVTRPPAQPRPLNAMRTGALLQPPQKRGLRANLWDDAHAILYEYSPVGRRYATHPSFHQPGLDQRP